MALNRSILDGSPLATPLAPHVQPAYYAAIIAAEAIGNSGSTKAVELTIANSNTAGYAFYESGTLARVLLINSKAYLSTTTTSRGFVHVNLDFAGSGTAPEVMEVKRFTIGYVLPLCWAVDCLNDWTNICMKVRGRYVRCDVGRSVIRNQ